MKRKFLSVLLALVLVLSFSLVTAVPAVAADLNVPSPYSTIQAAIDAANSGDTINVAAGTYTEDLDIPTGKDNLELKGASGATIKGVATEPDASFPLAVPNIDIWSSGVKIHGFTIEGPDAVANEYASGMLIGASNVEIYDNDFKVTAGRATWAGPVSTGIVTYRKTAVPTVDISGLNIHDNTFTNHGTGAAGFDAIYSNLDTGTGSITIADNEFTGNVARAITVERSNAVISGNSIITDLAPYTASAGGYQGMFIGCFPVDGDPGPVQSNVSITGNTVKGATTSEGFAQGIRVGHTTQVGLTNITVSQNTVQDSDEGITVRAEASGVTVNYNDIVGNTVGVQNDDSGVELDAQYNWWGDASGPSGQGSGSGDAVSTDVDYSPWEGALTGTSPMTWHTNDSIQDAIDAASNGDTIIAKDGTYTEDLKIENKTDITLRSENGKDVTTITTTAKPGIEIQGTATGFTLGGALGQGFTIDGTAGHLIVLSNNPSGVEISYNTIDTTDAAATRGISVGVAGATSLTVSNNTFTGSTGDGSLSAWDGPTSDVTVSGNTFQTGAYAIQFSGVTGTSTISGNTVTGYTGAGAIVITNGTGTSGLTISGNTITNCSYGVRFEEECIYGTAGDMTTVTVTYNSITGSTTDAIKIGHGDHVLASNFTISYNAFDESTGYGLNNAHNTEQVTAECNWWGHTAGPEITTNPYDAHNAGADSVTANVDYIPWMIHTTLVANEWNIYSTPIAPDAASNTVEKALDLWGADSGNCEAAYYFDSSASPQDWAIPTITTSLTPLRAVYLKMTAASTIDVCFSTESTPPPSRTMYQGWNLVGLAQLYDMDTDDAFLPAYYGTGEASLVGYSQAISPGIGGQANWTYLRDNGLGSGQQAVIPTEGYWVYMVNQGTLGGYTYTPITMVSP